MKQVIEVKITATFDYDNPELLELLKAKMVDTGMTADQIRAQAKSEIFTGFKELIDDDMQGEKLPGFTYTVEDISV